MANLRPLTITDIDVYRIPYNWTLLCTTCKQPFYVLYSIGLMTVVNDQNW